MQVEQTHQYADVAKTFFQPKAHQTTAPSYVSTLKIVTNSSQSIRPDSMSPSEDSCSSFSRETTFSVTQTSRDSTSVTSIQSQASDGALSPHQVCQLSCSILGICGICIWVCYVFILPPLLVCHTTHLVWLPGIVASLLVPPLYSIVYFHPGVNSPMISLV
jgi:hypothetical protein